MVAAVFWSRLLVAFLLVLFSTFFALFAFIFLEFGRVSELQVLSVLRTPLSGNITRLDLAASFAFIFSISLLGGVLLSLVTSRLMARLARLNSGSKSGKRLNGGPLAALSVTPHAVIAMAMFFLTISPTSGSDAGDGGGVTARAIPKLPASVVHVFVESLPLTLQTDEPPVESAELFLVPDYDWGLAPNLTSLAGHDNTILGLVSSWCASPFPAIEYNDPGSDKYGMKHIRCIHDYYYDLGFRLQFLGGYDSSFQDKSAYFTQKKIEVFDLVLWTDLESSGLDSWEGGLNDRQLLINSMSVIDSNLLNNSPFFLTLLTLDTHPPIVSPSYCLSPNPEEGLIKSVYSCVGELVKDFQIALDERATPSKPILLVIQGDHLPSGAGFTNGQDAEVFFATVCLGKEEAEPSTNQPEKFSEIAEFIIQESHRCGEAES